LLGDVYQITNLEQAQFLQERLSYLLPRGIFSDALDMDDQHGLDMDDDGRVDYGYQAEPYYGIAENAEKEYVEGMESETDLT
jgi:hypothetical protein